VRCSLDVSAIAALFRDHHAELVRLALLMLGDLATAEDVVQDVYASLHRRSRAQGRAQGRAQTVEAPLPYVRAAVLNGCRSVLRRRAIARRVGLAHRAALTGETTVRASAISAGTVKSTAARALAALARDLGEPS
jgi:DNA-directed RNA polymerase specialized sigma24 family protein